MCMHKYVRMKKGTVQSICSFCYIKIHTEMAKESKKLEFELFKFTGAPYNGYVSRFSFNSGNNNKNICIVQNW